MELSCIAVNPHRRISLQNHVISRVLLHYSKITSNLNIMLSRNFLRKVAFSDSIWILGVREIIHQHVWQSHLCNRVAVTSAQRNGLHLCRPTAWEQIELKSYIEAWDGLCSDGLWSFEFSAGFEFVLPTCKALTEPWGRAGVWLKTASPRTNQPVRRLECCT